MYYRFSNISKIIQKPLNELHAPFKSNTPTQKCNVEVIHLGPVYTYRHRHRARHSHRQSLTLCQWKFRPFDGQNGFRIQSVCQTVHHHSHNVNLMGTVTAMATVMVRVNRPLIIHLNLHLHGRSRCPRRTLTAT